jgi:hypothetical protein
VGLVKKQSNHTFADPDATPGNLSTNKNSKLFGNQLDGLHWSTGDRIFLAQSRRIQYFAGKSEEQ